MKLVLLVLIRKPQKIQREERMEKESQEKVEREEKVEKVVELEKNLILELVVKKMVQLLILRKNMMLMENLRRKVKNLKIKNLQVKKKLKLLVKQQQKRQEEKEMLLPKIVSQIPKKIKTLTKNSNLRRRTEVRKALSPLTLKKVVIKILPLQQKGRILTERQKRKLP